MWLLDRFKKLAKTTAPAVVKPVAQPVAKTTPDKAKPVAEIATQTAVSAIGYTAVLVRPLVTEKSTTTGAYYFKVAKSANKNEVAKAFKARYGKMPRKVNIVNVLGKTKFRGRTAGKRVDWKKAIVYLNKGVTVDTSK